MIHTAFCTIQQRMRRCWSKSHPTPGRARLHTQGTQDPQGSLQPHTRDQQITLILSRDTKAQCAHVPAYSKSLFLDMIRRTARTLKQYPAALNCSTKPHARSDACLKKEVGCDRAIKIRPSLADEAQAPLYFKGHTPAAKCLQRYSDSHADPSNMRRQKAHSYELRL